MEPSPYQQPPDLYSQTRPDTGNLGLAVAVGLVAAIVGAVLWATLVGATHL